MDGALSPQKRQRQGDNLLCDRLAGVQQQRAQAAQLHSLTLYLTRLSRKEA
ncbi:hypothetical protein [Stutzerimonas chloritidismutans]|uniref:hypothetical protein n=1 Tax=Stutzerimonas chloritidismutans TaxID=203192 RepID=UPI003F176A65